MPSKLITGNLQFQGAVPEPRGTCPVNWPSSTTSLPASSRSRAFQRVCLSLQLKV